MKKIFLIFLVSALVTIQAPSQSVPTLAPKHHLPDSEISLIAKRLISALNGRDQNIFLLQLGFPVVPDGLKDDLHWAMRSTMVFCDEEGKVWFVADHRTSDKGKWSSIFITSEGYFRPTDPGNSFPKWRKVVHADGEALFKALVATLPNYHLYSIEDLQDQLARLFEKPLWSQCEEAVIGDLRGRSMEMRVPSRTAYFMDQKDRCLAAIDFSTQGDPEHFVFFPDSGNRPEMTLRSIKPNAADPSKNVAVETKKIIWKAIQSAKTKAISSSTKKDS
jgi:hypothetical protein